MSEGSGAPVIVGVDGSPASTKALARGLWEAGRSGVGLVAVHAWHSQIWLDAMQGPGLRAQADPKTDRQRALHLVTASVHRAQAELADPNAVHVKAEAREGDAGAVLLSAASQARLLALGRSGRHGIGGVMLGSTVRYALQHAQRPVMIVPDTDIAATSPQRVIVGYDGEPSDDALRWAVRLARREHSPLLVRHTWAPPYPLAPGLVSGSAVTDALQSWLVEAVEATLAGVGASVAEVCPSIEAQEGSASATLLEAATPEDVLVIGARGRGGFRLLRLGSVALQLAEHAPCPVVVVR